MTQRQQTRIGFHTLGCKVNQYESDKLATRFAGAGYQLSSSSEEADVLVVNTCTVTQEADRKSRQVIRRMARRNRGSLVVVTGCHAAQWSDALDGVRVLKVNQMEKETLFSKVEEALFGSSKEMPEHLDYHTTPARLTRARAYLKVQDGCDRFCTYCIIPYVRGRSRSRPAEDILGEARQLIEGGVQEIVVTGICVGDYGHDFNPRETLSGLFEKLFSLGDSPQGTHPARSGLINPTCHSRESGNPVKLDPCFRRGDIGRIYETASRHAYRRLSPVKDVSPLTNGVRFRLSSFDPCDMDERLFDLLTSHPKMCRHLHLALQHGSDRILKRMGRDYSRQEFYILCREFKRRDPQFALTTDIIAGFPGEGEEDFESTLELAKETGFSKIHVFPYSERKGTGAVKHSNKVPAAVRDKRVEKLLALSGELSKAFHESLLGSRAEVLVEKERDKETRWLTGYTSNYVPVAFQGPDELMGQMVSVQLIHLQGHNVIGKMEDERAPVG